MTEAAFDPTLLNKNMPQDAQEAIISLLRAWVIFEIALTDWLIDVTEMNNEIGSLLIGRMDTRGKIDKLKEIYAHLEDKTQVKSLQNLSRSTEGYSRIKNTAVHMMYLGHRLRRGSSDEYELIYSTHRPGGFAPRQPIHRHHCRASPQAPYLWPD